MISKEIVKTERCEDVVDATREISLWKLKKVEELFEIYDKTGQDKNKRRRLLMKGLKYLKEVDNAHPELFKDEVVYLWEEVAVRFNTEGYINEMEFCLRKQVDYQLGRADAFLNMGFYFMGHGLIQKAINAYIEGVGTVKYFVGE